MKPALLVLDMIVDFTSGRLGSAQARAIRPAIAKLLSQARLEKIPVFYCQEAHLPHDPELKVWGRHGMFGTRGARIDPALNPKPGEPVIPKHTFGAFYGTDLQDQLKARQIDTLILTGVCTDICVQHTAGEAFFRGYRVIVVHEATAALTSEDHDRGLRYMARTYGTQITDLSSILRKLTLASLRAPKGRSNPDLKARWLRHPPEIVVDSSQ